MSNLAAILKRRAEQSLASDPKKQKQGYSVVFSDLKATVMTARIVPPKEGSKQTWVRESMCVQISGDDLSSYVFGEDSNGTYDAEREMFLFKLAGEDDYSVEVTPGQVMEFTKFYDIKKAPAQSKFSLGDQIVLKKVNFKPRRNGDGVIHDFKWAELDMSKTRTLAFSDEACDLDGFAPQSYWKIVDGERIMQQGGFDFGKIRVVERDAPGGEGTIMKCEALVKFNGPTEEHPGYRMMLWQDHLHKYGITHPDLLDAALESIFSSGDVLFAVCKSDYEPDDGSTDLKIRYVQFKQGSYANFIMDVGEDLSHDEMAAELEKTQYKDLAGENKLNNQSAGSKQVLMNVTESTMSADDFSDKTDFVKWAGCVWAVVNAN